MTDCQITTHESIRSHTINTTGSTLRRRLRRKATALVLVPLAGIAMAAALASSVSPAAAATSSYGETPYFHCATGQVVLDSIRIPTAELPAAFAGDVYIWYGGTWHYYTEVQLSNGAQTQGIANGYQNENQRSMSANVPQGYYYAIWVRIATRTHSASGVWASTDKPYGSYYCAA